MPRRLILRSPHRCERCRLAPRWCVCAAVAAVETPVKVDVVMHPNELWRPTSTGHLIGRALADSRCHLWQHEHPVSEQEVRRPGRELWVLHPAGGPMPETVVPESLQVVVIDGSWREASAIARDVASWGQLVSLPMTGQSRFWLRTQADGAKFSTVEALMFLLDALGLKDVNVHLRAQFELHVYAGLRARGNKLQAEKFLSDSPAAALFPELIAALNVRRPLEGTRDDL